jgi:hypothetical protein
MGHHRLRAKPTTDRRWSAPPEGIAAALPGRSCRTRPQQSGWLSTNSIDLRNSISPKGSVRPGSSSGGRLASSGPAERDLGSRPVPGARTPAQLGCGASFRRRG